MGTFFAGFIFFVLMIAIMAVGVIMGRTPIKGTCGGINQLIGDKECSFCGGDSAKCESQVEEERSSTLQYFQPELKK